MSVKAPKGWYDISLPIRQGMRHFPTTPIGPKVYRAVDRELGAPVTMGMIEMITHTGTHVDAPFHYIPGAPTISDMALDVTVGPCRVIEIEDQVSIKIAELEKYNIQKGERLLFKTRNSPDVYTRPDFTDDYVYFEVDATKYLAEKGVILVGIDSLSVGSFKIPNSIDDTHVALLGGGVHIVEDCALDGVPPGEYELLCLPLLMLNGDAGPARAILRPLGKA